MDKYIIIPLSKRGKNKGKYEAIVSIEDADLAELNWNVTVIEKNIYAKRNAQVNGKHKRIFLHRLIMERMLPRPIESHELVDHLNMDTLDNRRENLRLATQSQNQSNRGKAVSNKSGYKGVSWDKRAEKWAAYIRVKGKNIFLGFSHDPKECHEWYKEAAIKHFGEFARFD